MTIIVCPVPKRLRKTEVPRVRSGHRDCERAAADKNQEMFVDFELIKQCGYILSWPEVNENIHQNIL